MSFSPCLLGLSRESLEEVSVTEDRMDVSARLDRKDVSDRLFCMDDSEVTCISLVFPSFSFWNRCTFTDTACRYFLVTAPMLQFRSRRLSL